MLPNVINKLAKTDITCKTLDMRNDSTFEARWTLPDLSKSVFERNFWNKSQRNIKHLMTTTTRLGDFTLNLNLMRTTFGQRRRKIGQFRVSILFIVKLEAFLFHDWKCDGTAAEWGIRESCGHLAEAGIFNSEVRVESNFWATQREVSGWKILPLHSFRRLLTPSARSTDLWCQSFHSHLCQASWTDRSI